MNFPTWAAGSPAYRAYLTASERCADIFAGIRIESDRNGFWLYMDGSLVESDRKSGSFRSDLDARLAARAAKSPVAAPAVATPLQPGWSNAAKARRSGHRRTDGASDWMDGAFGVTSPARGHECHFCGVDSRTCDCH